MRFDNGFSTKEIAEICNVSESTVLRKIETISKELTAMRECFRQKDKVVEDDL